MKTKFTVREVKTYEVRTPIGPKRVAMYQKTGEIEEEIPDEIAEKVKDIPDFSDADLIVEGTGVVWIDMGNQKHPQQIAFRFPDDVKTVEQAFDKFDECMREEIKELQEEEKARSQSKIQLATPGDVQAISNTKLS